MPADQRAVLWAAMSEEDRHKMLEAMSPEDPNPNPNPNPNWHKMPEAMSPEDRESSLAASP